MAQSPPSTASDRPFQRSVQYSLERSDDLQKTGVLLINESQNLIERSLCLREESRRIEESMQELLELANAYLPI